jgi:hypothetical protein
MAEQFVLHNPRHSPDDDDDEEEETLTECRRNESRITR